MKVQTDVENKLDAEHCHLKNHHLKLSNSVKSEQLQELLSLKTDKEKFYFVYKLPFVDEIKVTASISEKNAAEANQFKEEGNKAFKNGNYINAKLNYDKSALKVPWSPESSKELSIIIANRSAVFYHLQNYSLALSDIEYALLLGYPEELKYKILDRKARCLLATKQLQDALQAFKNTLTALDSAKLPLEKRQKWQMDVQIMLAMLNKTQNLTNELKEVSEETTLPSVTGQKNTRYVSANSAVKIQENKEMGRYAEAGKDIQVGDILVAEQAFVAVLLSERASTHCFHCFRRLEAAIPCNQCSKVAFCSIACQKEALTTHHTVECPILETLWASGSSIICLMALRILSQRGLAYFLEMKDILNKGCDIVKSSEKYLPTDYRTVYNLVGHSEMRTALDFLLRSDTAVFLFQCLKVAGFFKSLNRNSANNLTDDEIFIGGLLLHHLQILQFNAHEISELQLEETGKPTSGESVFLGGGLFSTVALFNHSCDPGIVRYFHGTSVIVRAIKNISCGEMIAENYGQIFTQTPRDERRTILKSQYWFDCICKPCQEDWPLFNNMHQGIMRFRCETGMQSNDIPKCNNIIIVPTDTAEFMLQCSNCKKYTNILKGLKILQDTDAMFRTATRLMDEGKVQQALDKYIEILIILNSTLAPPFRDFHFCQQAIRRCMLYLGNKSIVPRKCK